MWDKELANRFKKDNADTREKATRDSTAFIGTIKQRNPLIVSVAGGELMYESDDIIESYAFHQLWLQTSPIKVNAGDDVIVIPVDSLDVIAVIDKVG